MINHKKGGKESNIGGAMIHFAQSEACDKVDDLYLAVAHDVSGFGPVFKRWTAAMYSDIYLVAKVNGHFSKSFSITRSVS